MRLIHRLLLCFVGSWCSLLRLDMAAAGMHASSSSSPPPSIVLQEEITAIVAVGPGCHRCARRRGIYSTLVACNRWRLFVCPLAASETL